MERNSETEPVHRRLDTEAGYPQTEIVAAAADIEDRDATELSPMYDCIGGVLDHIFSTPPAPEAQMQVAFNYEGFRITIEQDGDATFADVE